MPNIDTDNVIRAYAFVTQYGDEPKEVDDTKLMCEHSISIGGQVDITENPTITAASEDFNSLYAVKAVFGNANTFKSSTEDAVINTFKYTSTSNLTTESKMRNSLYKVYADTSVRLTC